MNEVHGKLSRFQRVVSSLSEKNYGKIVGPQSKNRMKDNSLLVEPLPNLGDLEHYMRICANS